jgi:hypothetical protein
MHSKQLNKFILTTNQRANMNLFWNYFKQKCMTSDDQAHTLDCLYSAGIHAENNVEKLQNKLEDAKQYLGDKYLVHPKNTVKRLKKVKHFYLENVCQ